MRTLIASVFLVGMALGCGSSASRPAECEAIVEACHPVDNGTGDIHECHENAEVKWTKDECVSNSARCSSLCKAVDAGAHD
jgi:hypothetical protein